jgi:hypothetical protein
MVAAVKGGAVDSRPYLARDLRWSLIGAVLAIVAIGVAAVRPSG